MCSRARSSGGGGGDHGPPQAPFEVGQKVDLKYAAGTRLAPLKYVEALGQNNKPFARVLAGLKDELVRAHRQRIALHGLLSFNMPQNAIQMILKNM